MMDDSIVCGSCIFFQPNGRPELSGMGSCHRSAPRALILNDCDPNPHAAWPWVARQDWCGEFRQEPL